MILSQGRVSLFSSYNGQFVVTLELVSYVLFGTIVLAMLGICVFICIFGPSFGCNNTMTGTESIGLCCDMSCLMVCIDLLLLVCLAVYSEFIRHRTRY